ncbi:hypothetical protein IKZ40_04970 [bacterium]|nr:hypothetical protein [bacterium]
MKNLFFVLVISTLSCLAGNLAFDLRDGSVPAATTKDTNAYVAREDQVQAFTDAQIGDTVTFATPEGIFSGTVNQAETDINGVIVRAGRIANDGGSFVVTVTGGELYGHIESIDTARDVRWEYVNGVQSINNLSFAEADTDFLNGKELPSPEGTQGADIEDTSINYYDYNDDEIDFVRIAVFYTPKSLEYAGSHNRMNSFIAEGVAKGNQCLMNSKINARILLVHSQQWNYEEAGSSYTDLSNFTNARNGWEGVHEVRNAVGADLCSIVAYVHDVGGLAYVNGSTLGMPESSYNLIRVLQMTGSSWIHEMGHNIGCNHAYEQDSSPGPESGGVFGHSLGYYFTGATDHSHYGTVMAYDQGDYHRCDYFSATNVTFKGTLVGYESRNNSLTWNKIRKVAKTYRILPTHTYGEWAYEGFNYPAGERLDLKTGGQGWNNGWTPDTVNAYATSAESLEYSDGVNMLATTPGSLKLDGDSVDFSRMPAQSFAEGFHYSKLGETNIWLSMLLKPTSDTHGRVYFNFVGNNAGITHDDLYAFNSYDPITEVHPVTGQTDLLLIRYEVKPDGVYPATMWVNPKVGVAPNEEDAVAKAEFNIYYSGYKDIYIYAYSANFYVDELRIGFSAESVLPVKAPFITATQDESAESITVSWTPDTAQQKVTIYRAGTRNFSEAAQVAEVTDASSWTDTDVEAGKLYYYWAEGEYSDSEAKRINGPALGYAGRPTITANANGPYVIQKGEDVTFSAEGSIGENLTYCWSCYKDISDYSPFYKDFLRTNNFSPGTYEVKLTIKDLGLTNAEPQTVTTQLIVKNADPIINFEKSEYNVACGVPSVFHAAVKDPMPQDKFQYCFRTDDAAEFSEWTDSSYYTATYDEPNSTHTMTCIVADNYGGTNTCTTTVKVGARTAIMSADPMTLDFQNDDTLLLRVVNSGAEPYQLNLNDVPRGFQVYPQNVTISNGVAVLLVKCDREFIRQNNASSYTGTLDLAFTNVTLKLSDTKNYTIAVNAGGPYTVKRGDTLLLSANGTSASDGLKYLWSIDDERIGEPSEENYLAYYTPADIAAGEHQVTLSVCGYDDQVLTNAFTTLTVVEAQPEMLFHYLVKPDGQYKIRCFMTGNGNVWASNPKVTEEWIDEKLVSIDLKDDNIYREPIDVMDSFGNTNHYVQVIDLRKEYPDFVLEICCNSWINPSEYSLEYGKDLKLRSVVTVHPQTGVRKYYWREWNGNPSKNVLKTPNEAETEVERLLPGVYYFQLYVSDGNILSLPTTVRVTVSGTQGLLYTAKGSEAFFLNGASIASDRTTCISDASGTFASDTASVTYQRLDSKTAHITLEQACGYYAKPVRISGDNWKLISGTVVTNFPWGEGPMEGVIVTAVNGDMSSKVITDAKGAFAIFMPENAGPTTLTFAKQNCAFQPVIVSESATLKIVPEKSEGNSNSYLYLTVIGKESSFYMEGVTVNCFGITGHTNSKGVTSNISAPKGVNSVTISMDGYDTITTNFTFAGTSTMRKVALARTMGRRGDSLDVIVRDTDAKLVLADQFRLVSAATSSIIVNYANEVSPLLSIPTIAGQKVIIRAQKEGYDNFSETVVLDNYVSRDIVFIPEPAAAAIIFALLAFAIHSRKNK